MTWLKYPLLLFQNFFIIKSNIFGCRSLSGAALDLSFTILLVLLFSWCLIFKLRLWLLKVILPSAWDWTISSAMCVVIEWRPTKSKLSPIHTIMMTHQDGICKTKGKCCTYQGCSYRGFHGTHGFFEESKRNLQWNPRIF